jgi:hypothetical protein
MSWTASSTIPSNTWGSMEEERKRVSLIMDEIRACNILGVLEESYDNRRICLIVHGHHCMMQNTIVRHIGMLGLLNVFPNIKYNGWMYHRLLVVRHEDSEEILRRLENGGWVLKNLRMVPFDGSNASSLTLTADASISYFTEKEIDALLTARRNGYYIYQGERMFKRYP